MAVKILNQWVIEEETGVSVLKVHDVDGDGDEDILGGRLIN